jgi:hypothetical protein
MATRQQSRDQYTFDGGNDDPRMLVYWYQQKVRTQLIEKTRRRWWSAYTAPLTRIARVIMTPNPDRSAPAQQTKITHAMF